MDVFLIISAFLSLFFSILVFMKKGKTYSDYLLGSWFLFIMIHMLLVNGLFWNAFNDYPYPNLIGTEISLVAVHPIWLFLYVLSYTNPNVRNYKALLHLIPIVILNLVLLYTFYLRAEADKIASFQQALEENGYIDTELEVSVLLVISISIAYLIASHWLLIRHKKKIKNQFSSLDGKDLKWLKVLFYGIASVIAINILSEWNRNYWDVIPADLGDYMGNAIIVLGISYVGFNGIRQRSIFTNESYPDNNRRLNKQTSPDKEQVLPTVDMENDYEKLMKFMKNEKPYREENLNLDALALRTGFRSRYLSEIINQKARMNFFDFVNSYRTNEFKDRIRLPENAHFTLLSIAYDCGFSSKATFNRVFKKHTGFTPSEFYNNPNLK